jgi:hypothetical protein
MGLAGAAAGAQDALQALLLQAFQRQQAEQQMAIQQQAAERQDSAFRLQERQFNADEAHRSGQRQRQVQQDDIAAADRRRTQGQQEVQRMAIEGLRTKQLDPTGASLMAAAEGAPIDMDVLDPDRPQRQRIELEGVRNRNELQQIAAQGQNSMAVATARTAGTRDATTQRRIDSLAKGFDSQPTVRRAQLLAESAKFAQSLNANTTNPADDQALIYNFAKSMDPDSAVREGEYATVQRYAQSLAEKFGFDVTRVFSNTPFLTPEARQNMKATIMERYQAARGGYDSLRKSYGTKLSAMGGDDADLIDYGAGFPSVDQPQDQAAPQRKPIPGIPGGIAELRDGKWIRVQ